MIDSDIPQMLASKVQVVAGAGNRTCQKLEDDM